MKETLVGEIRKYITEKPAYVHQNDSIHSVIRKFVENPVIRAVYVIDDEHKLQGIITIREILKRISVDFYSLSFIYSEPSFTGYNIMGTISQSKASDIMNTEIYYVEDNDTIEKAFNIMFQNDAGEIPVVEKDLKLIGDLNVIELLVLWDKKQNVSNSGEGS